MRLLTAGLQVRVLLAEHQAPCVCKGFFVAWPHRRNTQPQTREIVASHDEPRKRLEQAWITQAEAARLRGITRQAIFLLVKNGRLRSRHVAGSHVVLRKDVLEYKSERRGRPRKGWQ